MSDPDPIRWRRVSILCAATGCTLALAACGSSKRPNSASTAGSPSLVKYSECIRSHGVPDFPDPSTTETPNSFGIDGYNFSLPSNLNLQSPAYESAQETCSHLINLGTGSSHNFSVVKARQAALVHAECMRKHGVPSFPDPTVSGGSQGITVSSDDGGINPQSPAFQHAQKVCQRS